MQGVGFGNKGNSAGVAVDTALQGPGGSGGLLSQDKDAKASAKEAQFGDVWKQVQAKYGAKADKPREIKKTLGKDDFLKIMMTQMKHQDPTKPFNAEQMAQQIAQFTSVEQLQNLNQSMGKMASQNQPLERLAMTNMIGKTVTIDRERFPHTEGQNESLNFALPRDAKEVHVTVIADTGETVLEKELGELKQGENTFSWDGLKSNTLPAKSGNYMYRVEAKDDRGASIPMSNKGQAKVVGVSFEGSEAVFLVGDINRPDKVTMRNIVRVDSDPSGMIPGAIPMNAALGNAAGSGSVAVTPVGQSPVGQPKQNFFTFEKGIGSSNIDAPAAAMPKMAPQVASAPAQTQTTPQSAPQITPQMPSNSANDSGFPNGLTSERMEQGGAN